MKKQITHNKKKYKYFLLLKNQFLELLKYNQKMIKSYISLMKKHRGDYYSITHMKFMNKYHMFSVITDVKQTEIVTLLILHKKVIKNVHTSSKYRNQGFCEKNLSLITKNINYKYLKLYVFMNNIPAIRCYEKSGFLIASQRKDTYKMEYRSTSKTTKTTKTKSKTTKRATKK